MESKPVEYPRGTVWELPDGTVHREDGPAVIRKSGTLEWWINNGLHRVDGPAVEWGDGIKWWYINNIEVTIKISQWAKEFNIDLDNLSDEDKQMIVLYWGEYGK